MIDYIHLDTLEIGCRVKLRADNMLRKHLRKRIAF